MKRALIALIAISSCTRSGTSSEPKRSFIAMRADFTTELVSPGPSPQRTPPLRDEQGARLITYQSPVGEMRGLLALPKNQSLKSAAGYPVLFYLHGGFALGVEDIFDARPFLDSGFAVLTPAYRGENGNPGAFEFWYGELDDAIAALRSIRDRPELDGSRVVVTGHSAGGALTALMSLVPDLPILAIGSIGGWYAEDIFKHFPRPFGPRAEEARLRLAYRWADQLAYPHVACVGADDQMPLQVVKSALPTAPMLELKVVQGGHGASKGPCMEDLLARVLNRVTPNGGALTPIPPSSTKTP